MANEQAQAETTDQGETPQQTSLETDNGSEAELNTSAKTSKEGDLRVPLQEERQKRQALEASLNDPQFVLQRARDMGLVEEELPSYQSSTDTRKETNEPYNVQSQVQFMFEMERAKEKYPELMTDDGLGRMVSGLVQQGISPLKAAETVFTRLNKIKEQAQSEGANQAKTEISNKEKAQTVTGATDVSSEVAEYDRLKKASRSPDKRVAREARLEILRRRNKESGIF